VNCFQIQFFTRFSQDDPEDAGVAIGMPAKLQPVIQLTMMGQQGISSIDIDDPGRWPI